MQRIVSVTDTMDLNPLSSSFFLENKKKVFKLVFDT